MVSGSAGVFTRTVMGPKRIGVGWPARVAAMAFAAVMMGIWSQ